METKTQTYLCPECGERNQTGNNCWNCGGSLFMPCDRCQPIGNLRDVCVRRVANMKVVNKADPTQAYTLTCGHTVI